MTFGTHALVAMSSTVMTGIFYASAMPKGWVMRLIARGGVR